MDYLNAKREPKSYRLYTNGKRGQVAFWQKGEKAGVFGRYQDFKTGEHGDMIQYFSRIHEVSMVDAAKILREKLRLDLVGNKS